MKHKLIEGSSNDIYNPIRTILQNRGVENAAKYLNLNSECLNPHWYLDNMDKAVALLIKHINKNSHIHILFDCDVDGYTSGAMTHNYIVRTNPKQPLSYSIHTGKSHGLSNDVTIPDDCELLIIPDAGTNDVEQCKALKERGIDILILDHHLRDEELPLNQYAVIVNNQMSDDYPNKNLCGAGIVYKFLCALDEELWQNYADDYLDLCAIGNIGDMMDIREYETKYLIEKGLRRINNKFVGAIIERQSYSMNNHINIRSVQFYIVPVMNAMIRIGEQDEKDTLVRALIETDEEFEYRRYKSSEPVMESVYTRAARLCCNAKSRQDNKVKARFSDAKDSIYLNKLEDNKLLFVNTNAGELNGYLAMKLAKEYNKPCIAYSLPAIPMTEEDGNQYIYGSIRNVDYSPIDDLKEFMLSTGEFEYIRGHENAAGFKIKADSIKNVIEKTNEILKDFDMDNIVYVDFDCYAEDLELKTFHEVNKLKDIYGTKIDEPLAFIRDIPIDLENMTLMGKNLTSWKCRVYDYFDFCMFNTNDTILNMATKLNGNLITEGRIALIDAIVTLGMNEYNGILTPQAIIKHYDIVKLFDVSKKENEYTKFEESEEW